ncbi:alpha/beta fold hydrolase [Streptomyces sp. NRRL S-237]|uniref:alpha/beta fold hydrolase n=1 Tax=Streptomyces sp. NRRL S-237 TaxID=1463895 RepID=UPI0004C728BB|nr:alpha/beta hydrolase [Streptomyces sp. NRRL S-237]
MVLEVETWTSPSPRIAPILAVRGLAEGESVIRPQTEALVPLADVVSVRIAGLTAPGVLPPDHGLDDLADGLGAVLDELGLSKANVCGISHAGEIAYRFAVRHPERMERVVLTGVTGQRRDLLPPGTGADEMVELMKGPKGREMADHVISSMLCQDPALPVRGRAAMRWALAELIDHVGVSQIHLWFRCLELLQEVPERAGIAAPVLAVTGEHDVPCPPADCRALAALSSGSVFATIREADHFVFLTRAGEHLDLTRRFLLDEPLEDLPYVATLERFPHVVACASS